MAYQYLFDPNKQFQNVAGTNNVAGFLRVFYNGTDDRAVTYKDFNGTANPADIPIDNNGRAVVIVNEDMVYRLEVYNRDGALLWSQYPLLANGGGAEIPKQFFLYNRGESSASRVDLKNSSVQKLKIVSSGSNISKSENFEIDEENNAINGLDPGRRYIVNASWMYTGVSSTPHHIFVSGTQWTLLNFYSEFTIDNGNVGPEWRSMSWIITGKESLSLFTSCSDATSGDYVEIWLIDLQIVEI